MNINYQSLINEALRTVIMSALKTVSDDQVMGKYEIYLTLDTTNPNVEIPEWLHAEFPSALTIVLNEQFDDLVVDVANEVVSVTLSFKGVPVRVTTPLRAIIAYADVKDSFQVSFVDESEIMPSDPAVSEAVDNSPKEGKVVSLDAFRKKD